jgi:hypothetical protein
MGGATAMDETRHTNIIDAFLEQAVLAEKVGSPFTAKLLRSLSRVLSSDTRTGEAILNWPGDPMIDALKLRIAGGLHCLARSGDDPELSALYAGSNSDMDGVLARVMREWDDALYPWLASAPQTNEVGRSAMLWPGMMAVAARNGPEVEILELGASAGLNLNMDRYGYDLSGMKAGDPLSPVQLKPEWSGAPPAVVPVNIISRLGVDINPLDATRKDVADKLMAYIWPDQKVRLARLESAIGLAALFPPQVEKADAADWIEQQLGKPQRRGVTRVIFHSVVLQYLPPDARQRVIAAIKHAGLLATADRPLAWLSMEFTGAVKSQAALRLSCWPGSGESQLLARVHPHGAAITWEGQVAG